MNAYRIILFYKFTPIEDPSALRDAQKALCERLGLKGRMLIAEEGVNATFEGTCENIEAYKSELRADPRFSDIVFKESDGTGRAFPKLKVKVRREVVTLGVGNFDVRKETAAELTADELEELYRKGEDFVVLDLRNDYEIQAGHFEKTVNPKLDNFRDLPKKLPELDSLKDKKVVAVCTGGIRCEKATCLLRREGFTNLYQLKDGIHTYMEKYPASKFKGTLYVFDDRIVTPVKDAEGREIVGRCSYCSKKTEHFYNDDRFQPSKKIMACESCARAHKDVLRGVMA